MKLETSGSKDVELKALGWLQNRRKEYRYEMMPDFAVVDLRVLDELGETVAFIEVKHRAMDSKAHSKTFFKQSKVRNGWDLLKKTQYQSHNKELPKYYYMAIWSDMIGIKELTPEELQDPEKYFGTPVTVKAANDPATKTPLHYRLPVNQFVKIYEGNFIND